MSKKRPKPLYRDAESAVLIVGKARELEDQLYMSTPESRKLAARWIREFAEKDDNDFLRIIAAQVQL